MRFNDGSSQSPTATFLDRKFSADRPFPSSLHHLDSLNNQYSSSHPGPSSLLRDHMTYPRESNSPKQHFQDVNSNKMGHFVPEMSDPPRRNIKVNIEKPQIVRETTPTDHLKAETSDLPPMDSPKLLPANAPPIPMPAPPIHVESSTPSVHVDLSSPPEASEAHTSASSGQEDEESLKVNAARRGRSPSPAPANLSPLEVVQLIMQEAQQRKSEVDEFTGKKTDKQCIFLEEMLTRLLIKLDRVDSQGKDEIRKARKEAVKTVQSTLDQLEAKTSTK